MDIFKEFLSQYGVTILYTVLTVLAGYVGITAKKIYEKICNDQTKKSVVKTCVQAVEQVYTDLHGQEKFDKCVEAASEILSQKGVKITELELKMLIESAVKEFNYTFHNTVVIQKTEVQESPEEVEFDCTKLIDEEYEGCEPQGEGDPVISDEE